MSKAKLYETAAGEGKVFCANDSLARGRCPVDIGDLGRGYLRLLERRPTVVLGVFGMAL